MRVTVQAGFHIDVVKTVMACVAIQRRGLRVNIRHNQVFPSVAVKIPASTPMPERAMPSLL